MRLLGVLILGLGLRAGEGRWAGAWMAAPDQAGVPLKVQTIRQVIRLSLGGTRIRLRVSNAYGTEPLRIGPVRVARADGTEGRAVAFQGAAEVRIPPGGSAWSDPVDFPVSALQRLAVSLHLPEPVARPTLHGAGLATAQLLPGPDATAVVTLPGVTLDDSRYFLADVEVEGPGPRPAFVAFGDSITDGVGSGLDADGRWPDRLAERLQADPALASIAVLNAGIAGNRLLRDGADPFVGPRGLDRFDRDVLDKPGVRWVLILVGGNDLSASTMLADPGQHATAAQVIEGLRALVARARAKGIRIWAGTLLPRGGAKEPFRETPALAAAREAVRRWIRHSGCFEGVVDFAALLGDPAHPDRLNPSYDSGDGVHPNAAGHRAMAGALDLRWFREDPR